MGCGLKLAPLFCGKLLCMPTTSLSTDLFRRVMGSFPTGVTVVTVEREDGRVHGMTANSLTSVSLEPMLILICVDQKARLHTYLKAQKRFGVNILRASQHEWSRFFAKLEQDPAEEQRLGVKFRWTPLGIPVLEGALAHLACNVVAQHSSGDHTIFVGEVESLEMQEGEPLVHHRGKYRRLKTSEE